MSKHSSDSDKKQVIPTPDGVDKAERSQNVSSDDSARVQAQEEKDRPDSSKVAVSAFAPPVAKDGMDANDAAVTAKDAKAPAKCAHQFAESAQPSAKATRSASGGVFFWLRAIRFLIVLFLSVVTCTVGVVVGVTVYRTYFAVPGEIEVPVIQGKDLREVNQLLNDMGLRLRLEEGKYSNQFPEQIVISQRPAPGKTVRQDREVLAVVSLGPELMTVPDLKGKSLRDVDILLADSKLTLGKVKEVEKEGVKTSEVVTQKPTAGTRVKRGTPVNIEVNKGMSVAGVVVPNWCGKNIASAQALVKKVGLKVGRISWSPSTAAQQGFIIKQSPPSGSEVAAGSEVELEVSAGAASDRMLVQRKLDLNLPKGSSSHDVRIVLVSGAGEEEVYRAQQIVGDNLQLWVSGCAGSDIEIFINNNLVKRDRL